MQKTAVLIYNQFCNFEISVALEALALGGRSVTINPIEDGYLISGNIITSVSYEFVRFGLAFGRLLGIDIPPETFGIKAVD